MFVRHTIELASPGKTGELASIITLTETGAYKYASVIVTGGVGISRELYSGPRIVYGVDFTLRTSSKELLVVIRRLLDDTQAKILQFRG